MNNFIFISNHVCSFGILTLSVLKRNRGIGDQRIGEAADAVN